MLWKRFIQKFNLFFNFILGISQNSMVSENQEIFTSHSQNFCVPPKHFPEGETRKRSWVYVIIDLDVTYLISWEWKALIHLTSNTICEWNQYVPLDKICVTNIVWERVNAITIYFHSYPEITLWECCEPDTGHPVRKVKLQFPSQEWFWLLGSKKEL